MKAILMSIQSKWLAKILNGEKTVELRKRFPKDYRGWVYLYCTKAKPYITQQSNYQFTIRESKDFTNLINGKVVARVWVDNVETIYLFPDGVFATKSLGSYDLLSKSRLLLDDFISYFNINERIFNHNIVCYHLGFAIYFSKLEIFDEPKELNDFSVDHSAKWRMPIKAPIIKAPQSWQYVEVEEWQLEHLIN